MARTFVLPDLGEGLIEAEIRAVLVHEGDVVKEDSPLLEVETDKAQVEIPSPFAGRVEKIHVHPGQTVKVGEPLVSFADGGGEVIGFHEGEDGAEDFFAGDGHVGRDIGEDGGSDEGAALITADGGVAAIEDDSGT